ncbi:VWA domain-containing protein [Sulfidibacter corallicola]|uniref:VWA domain-containing protein n=1 Tax=Sulfidibacter corallicola TaxID=2818388 RepID=A0A8A4TM35_SULCO|nr:VWA domain-containing protein [Sulfidibacter corallicola]QTD50527.1 VWA domain-containing protein [Sulfidibacter corallicola]
MPNVRLLANLASTMLVCGFFPVLCGQITGPDPQEPLTGSQSFQFSLIQIPVWVADKRGRPVGGLTADDFRLIVDDRQVVIEGCAPAYDRPMEVVYLLDMSGSMEIGHKLLGSVQTIDYLLDQHQRDDLWKVIIFSDSEVLAIADQEHKSHWHMNKNKLKGYGKTALFDALSSSQAYFSKDGLTNRALLLFTDGNDNQSRLTEEQLLKVLRIIDVPVFIVGIADGFVPSGSEDREDLGLKTLQEITTITGGELIIAKDARQLPQISALLTEKMRPQYMLSITVEKKSGDPRRRLDVVVDRRGDHQVRFRRGYVGSMPEIVGGN